MIFLFSYIKTSVLALCIYSFQQRCRCPVCQVGRGTCASALLPPLCRSSSWFRVWRSPFMCCCCRPSSWGLSSSSLRSCSSSMGWSSCSGSCLYWPFQGEHLLISRFIPHHDMFTFILLFCPGLVFTEEKTSAENSHRSFKPCNICLMVYKVEVLWWASSLSERRRRWKRWW